MTTIATSTDIDARIRTMATQIIDDFAGSSPLFVCLLRGAAPFASKLMFEIARQAPTFHPELDYMMVSTYGTSRIAEEPRVIVDLAPDTSVEGRSVIILDDVLDKGITADFVASHLQQKGALDIILAVLVEKQIDRPTRPHADYAALTAPDAWLAGMGMDDAATGKEAYRWAADIQALD